MKNYPLPFLVTTSLFSFFILFWLFIFVNHSQVNERVLDTFSDTYGLIALFASLTGFYTVKNWGGLKSALGKSITLFSVGLLFQFLGQLTYAFYRIVLEIENPYPSFAEIFYFGSIPIYLAAIWYLSTTMRVLSALKKPINLIGGILITLLCIYLDYELFLRGYEYSEYSYLVIFLDHGYAILQAIFVAFAVFTFFLSKEAWKGLLRWALLAMVTSLYFQYAADTFYTYRTIEETWYAGDYTDLLYILAYFSMSLSFIAFNSVYTKIKSNGGPNNQDRDN